MATIIIGKRLPHEGDKHLFICLVQWSDRKYSTHYYNEQTKSLNHGNYFEMPGHGISLFSLVGFDFAHRCERLDVALNADQILNVEVGA